MTSSCRHIRRESELFGVFSYKDTNPLLKTSFNLRSILEIVSNNVFCFFIYIIKLQHLFIEVGIDYPTVGFTVLQENFPFLGSHIIGCRFREDEFNELF